MIRNAALAILLATSLVSHASEEAKAKAESEGITLSVAVKNLLIKYILEK